MPRKILITIGIITGAIIILIILMEAAFRIGVPKVYSSGGNGLWLRHSWVGEKHTAQEYRELADRLHAMKVTDAFFHAGPLEADGSVPPEKIKYAPDLVKNMKEIAPGIGIQAWLGQIEAEAGGPLDISSPEVRKGVIDTARQFLDMGFDGIHYDIEPIYSGDENFITLLNDTHNLTRSRGKALSIAAHKPEPVPGIESLIKKFISYTGYWKRDYFLRVSKEVDQVAVMSYDAGVHIPFLYGGMIAWITEWSVNNGVEKLFIGIPSYDERTAGHFPCVENVNNAIIGLKRGVGKLKPEDREKAGGAIYANWTTSDKELEIYLKKWIGEE